MTSPMDQETLEKIGGKVKWIEVPYTTTKLSVETGKNRWQTAGGDTIIARVEVGKEADPVAVFNATREWLKQLAVEANKVTLDKLLALYNKYHKVAPSQPTLPVPPKKASVKTGPAPVVSDDEDIFDVDTIMVEFMPDGVTKSAKAKGGRWSKYGVKVWPEVLALPPLEWDLDSLDAAEYPVPKGLQAVVMMHEGKPRKVLEWK